jgi:hypothetical protein
MGSPGDLETDFMERESVALADALTSPSQYMLRWMREQGWRLPANSYVQQNILSPYLRQCWEEGSAPLEPGAIRELIFFGRLEERKGVGLFCDALDRLAPLASGFAVTFLGKPAMVDGATAPNISGGGPGDGPFVGKRLPIAIITRRCVICARAGRVRSAPLARHSIPVRRLARV